MKNTVEVVNDPMESVIFWRSGFGHGYIDVEDSNSFYCTYCNVEHAYLKRRQKLNILDFCKSG
jgi:hypothetical protein